jgi:hypothetical protein
MAKKKRPAKPVKPMVLGMRGSPDWKAWLDALAAECRVNLVTLIDHALVEYAAKRGFRPPPPR